MTEENFEEMLNESFAADAGVSIGEKRTARVVSIGAEYVFLDLGTRSEGMVVRDELERDGEITVAVGDAIEVVTSAIRDGAVMCATRLGQGSVERTDDSAALVAQLQDAFDAGLSVEGKVKETNKGGFNVDVFGIRAFCPISQIDITYCDTPDEHVGRTYEFLITRIENDGRNVVVSRRALLQKEADAQKEKVWETLHDGQVLDGKVASLQPYGAFVNIGGVEGLLHISEISHTRLKHPEEVLEKGQALKVQIKELNSQTRKISLSLKSLLEDPWDEFVATTTTGAVFNGRVAKIADFGAFVELADGIQGLVHISQMKTAGHASNPRSIVSVGQVVEVRVLEVDPQSRRVSLTLVDKEAEQEEANTEAFRASQNQMNASSASMGTLGDLLGKSLKK
ncbi:MAG: S1 RNA-binding domain-containing protein [Deltaproteobacteria bacterium]|nr:S1 RNA-binding domain-containing protein [Deltaproteobacteria bacterium]MBN2670943.1 S1 RNA-binding domain-containing protein [Deltaproteobacteria bacterium]